MTVDLEDYSGIPAAECSNAEEIKSIIKGAVAKRGEPKGPDRVGRRNAKGVAASARGRCVPEGNAGSNPARAPKVNQDREPNFRIDGKLFLCRCFACDPRYGTENHVAFVAEGKCWQCGWTDKGGHMTGDSGREAT